jgi:hypothetical protein
MVPPTAQVTGINEKPRAMFDSSVSSAIMLFMTPMFPLSIPCRQRLAKPSQSERFPRIRDTPKYKCRERTGKAKQDAGDDGT